MKNRRTYWHLEELKRSPSLYEIATSQLLPYVQRGFEVETPVADWYARYQRGACLTCSDWDRFRDPRETTYSTYVARQAREEQFVDGVLKFFADSHADARISPPWLAVQDLVLAPTLFPMHGLQMVAAYLGSMAPSGRIALAALFQAADELRRVQRVAYRVRQIQSHHPAFGTKARAQWERNALWQPWRALIEKLMTTYDWGEAFIATNLVVKPTFDEFFFKSVALLSPPEESRVHSALSVSLLQDNAWQRAYSHALVEILLVDSEQNRKSIDAIVARWSRQAFAAGRAFAPAFAEIGGARFGDVIAELESARKMEWSRLGLSQPGERAAS